MAVVAFMKWYGVFSTTATYPQGAVVSDSGNLFFCLLDGTLNRATSNTTYWTPVTAAGVVGPQGQQGIQGIQGIQGPAGATNPATVKLTGDLGATTSTTLANTTGLSFAVTSGVYYYFRFGVVFTSVTTTTGIKIGLTTPTTTMFSANVQIPVAADATSAMFSGWITSSGDSVVGTGVQTTIVPYLAFIDGFILPSANGTLQVQHAAEVAAAGNVIVKQGSFGLLYTLP